MAEEFKDLTYRTLNEEQRRTLDNTFIQATIVRSDGTAESLDAVYQIFSGSMRGNQLTPHEIRVALYAGPFIDYLTSLNVDEAWRSLYGPELAQTPGTKDHPPIHCTLRLTR